jgi:gentisate 1,2-dioxygenase
MDFPPAKIVDRVGWTHPEHHIPPAAVWRKADIEREIARLMNTSPETGRRTVILAHEGTGPELGNSFGIGVAISVLSAGEATPAHRHTHSVINYIREGHGHSIVDGRKIHWGPNDIFTTPGWVDHQHVADPDSPPVVHFSFSDRPLHEKLGLSLYKDAEQETLLPSDEPALADVPPPPPAPPTGETISEEGARLLTYKHMLKPESAWDEPLLWRFEDVKPHLDELDNNDPTFNGRRVVMLFHPGTGIAQGTTRTLTAFVVIILPGEEHIAHRHTSSAINYYFAGGGGYSVVGGQRFEWERGDVALAPGWAPHRHANNTDETVWGITVHDAPLLYNAGSLLWQEVLSEEIGVLGRGAGLSPAGAR